MQLKWFFCCLKKGTYNAHPFQRRSDAKCGPTERGRRMGSIVTDTPSISVNCKRLRSSICIMMFYGWIGNLAAVISQAHVECNFIYSWGLMGVVWLVVFFPSVAVFLPCCCWCFICHSSGLWSQIHASRNIFPFQFHHLVAQYQIHIYKAYQRLRIECQTEVC